MAGKFSDLVASKNISVKSVKSESPVEKKVVVLVSPAVTMLSSGNQLM